MEQLAGARGPRPSCSLVVPGLKEEVEKEKGEKSSLRAAQGGAAQATAPSASLRIPILRGLEPRPAGHCTHVLSAIRRQCYLGGATHSSGPQYTSVPCPVPCTAAAHADIAAARHGSTAHPHDRLLHAALTILCARQAYAKPPGQHRPVCSFVEAERDRDVNIKSDFSLSDALFALMGARTAPAACVRMGSCARVGPASQTRAGEGEQELIIHVLEYSLR